MRDVAAAVLKITDQTSMLQSPPLIKVGFVFARLQECDTLRPGRIQFIEWSVNAGESRRDIAFAPWYIDSPSFFNR
jgi:hypothetical protein